MEEGGALVLCLLQMEQGSSLKALWLGWHNLLFNHQVIKLGLVLIRSMVLPLGVQGPVSLDKCASLLATTVKKNSKTAK